MDFKKLQLIFYSLVGGQVLFAGVVFFMLQNQQEFADIPYFSIIVPAAVLGGAFVGYYLNNQLLISAAEQKTEEDQLMHYRRRVILRLALTEVGNLVALMGALLTGKITFFLFFALGMAIFFYFRPRLVEMANDYPPVK
ncbi:MAG TPA: hypothetical protein VJ953_15225 [Saprospiraceae bacterium]|nr:hypothetical protein [Saprospiraceae bacterium]